MTSDVDDIAVFEDVLRRLLVGPLHARAGQLRVELADAEPRSRVGDVADDGRNDVAVVDAARPAIDLDRFDSVAFGDDVAARLAEAAPLVDAPQAAVDGLVRGLLQPDVEPGLDGQAALVQRLGAVLRFEMLADLFEEVGRDAALAGGIAADDHRFQLRSLGDLARDEPFIRHALERVVAAAPGRLGIDEGALPDVALDDAGDRRGLLEAQILRRLPEIQLRGGFDAVGAVAEVDLIA